MRPLMIAAAACVTTMVTLAAQAPAHSVWDGAYTAAQAERGKAQYAASCARCHGASLEGGMGRSLVGDSFWNKWREQSVADLLDYVSKNMPMGQTSTITLSAPVYADLVAFLLKSNDLPAGPTALNAATGTGILLVPKTGATGELPASTLARVVGCLQPQVADRTWRVTGASRPERVKAIDAIPTSKEGGDREYALKFVLQQLAPLVGQQVAVVGILLGEGGADGINVSTVTAVAPRCD
jgi:mono/diheme cytochrome c family protein